MKFCTICWKARKVAPSWTATCDSGNVQIFFSANGYRISSNVQSKLFTSLGAEIFPTFLDFSDEYLYINILWRKHAFLQVQIDGLSPKNWAEASSMKVCAYKEIPINSANKSLGKYFVNFKLEIIWCNNHENQLILYLHHFFVGLR